MKKIGISFLLSIIFISCNNTNNEFSNVFKDNFKRECIKNAKVNLSTSKAESYCNCVLGVVMTKYGSESEANKKMLNMSMNDLTELVEPCR
ncbi:hypothetical protein N9L60_04955 [Flavobacteriales bacterium]|nr:hypothetical protein [Flavobacteriales bacterium]